MPENKQQVLLSIKPAYAEKIFNGTKTVELRRSCLPIEDGDDLVVYVSSPVKAIMAIITIGKIVSGQPSLLWPKVSKFAGISKHEFDEYYKGATIAFAIYIHRLQYLKKPIRLEDIRKRRKGFNPPQSYRYVDWNLLRQAQ